MAAVNESERLARAWIEGWNAGKPDEIPLAIDFVHTSPFGTVRGRDTYLDRVRSLAAQNVMSLKILRILGVVGEAAIWFEMETPGGVVQVCDWVQTENGQIVAITSFYDPTVLRDGEEQL